MVPSTMGFRLDSRWFKAILWKLYNPMFLGIFENYTSNWCQPTGFWVKLGPRTYITFNLNFGVAKKFNFTKNHQKTFPELSFFVFFTQFSLFFEHSMHFKYILDKISDFLTPIRLLNSLNRVSERQIKTEAPFWF